MRYTLDTIDLRQPLVPAYGAGVDSTAMLVGLVERRAPIEAILFANTGAEKPETLSYIAIMSAWLRERGYPGVTVVSYRSGHGRYDTLGTKCVANQMLPSLAYGGKSCSIVFKAEVQDTYLRGRTRGHNKSEGLPAAAAAWRMGLKVVRAIGYDAGPKDARRADIPEDQHYQYVYPLREWGWDRLKCMEVILAAGLPLPIKSACYFCPASKPQELVWLHARHPDLFMSALFIEENARPRLTTVEGLWRKSTRSQPGSWVTWALREGLVQRCADGTLSLIPSSGPTPDHPDDELMRMASRKAA